MLPSYLLTFLRYSLSFPQCRNIVICCSVSTKHPVCRWKISLISSASYSLLITYHCDQFLSTYMYLCADWRYYTEMKKQHKCRRWWCKKEDDGAGSETGLNVRVFIFFVNKLHLQVWYKWRRAIWDRVRQDTTSKEER